MFDQGDHAVIRAIVFDQGDHGVIRAIIFDQCDCATIPRIMSRRSLKARTGADKVPCVRVS